MNWKMWRHLFCRLLAFAICWVAVSIIGGVVISRFIYDISGAMWGGCGLLFFPLAAIAWLILDRYALISRWPKIRLRHYGYMFLIAAVGHYPVIMLGMMIAMLLGVK